MALKTEFVYYRARNDKIGLVVLIEDAQKNGVDITGLNGLVLIEVDSLNQPGLYRINLTDAILIGANVLATPGDVLELYINGQGAGNSAPAVHKFRATAKDLDDLSSEIGVVSGKIDVVDGVVDDILVDTADMQPRVIDTQSKVTDNKGNIESVTFGLSALKALIDAVQSTVNGISNVTRFSASLAPELIIPPAGNTDSRVFMHLTDNIGNLEDPDANQIEVTAFDAVGNDVTATHLIFGGQVDNGGGKVDAVRDSLGQYRIDVRVPTGTAIGVLTLKFEYTEGGADIASSRATLLVDDVQSSGAALESTSQIILTDTNEIQQLVTDGVVGLAAIKALLVGVDVKVDTIDGIVDAILADVQSGVFGLEVMKTAVDTKSSQASVDAVTTNIDTNVKGAGFDNAEDTLHQISTRVFTGGVTI